MWKKVVGCACLALTGWVSSVGAAVTVVVTGGVTTSSSSPGSGVAFTLTAAGNGTATVYGSSSDDIGRITLSGYGAVKLLVGNSGSFPTNASTPLASALADDWNGLELSSFTGSVQVAAHTAGGLTGSITTTQVFRLEIDGTLGAGVTAIGVDASPAFAVGPVLVGDSTTSSGVISATATPGTGEAVTIRRIDVGGGVMSGSEINGAISAAHGKIGTVIARGDISISSGGITASTGIDLIECLGSISATIAANVNGGDGGIGEIDALGGGVAGSIAARNLIGGDEAGIGMSIEGDLSATVSFSGSVGAPVFVAGSITGTFSATTLDSNIQAVGDISSLIISAVSAGNDNIGTARLIESTTGRIDSLLTASLAEDCMGAPSNCYVGAKILAGNSIGTITCTGPLRAVIGGVSSTDRIPIDAIYADEVVANGSNIYCSICTIVDVAGNYGGTFTCHEMGFFRTGGQLLSSADISVESEASLTGQIIINAANTSSTWAGDVVVETTSGPVAFNTTASQPYQAPYYDALSTYIGGGAIGLVPYFLHKTDCLPPMPTLIPAKTTRRARGPAATGAARARPSFCGITALSSTRLITIRTIRRC